MVLEIIRKPPRQILFDELSESAESEDIQARESDTTNVIPRPLVLSDS